MTRLLVAALVALGLAGCFGPPEVPDDATVTTDDALELRLSAWTEMRGGRLTLNGLIENTGDQHHPIRVLCGHPWESRILGPNGTVPYVEVQEPPACAPQWDELRPNGHHDFLHSWDFQGHDPATGESWSMPGGDHAWVLRFWLRDDVTYLETVIPFSVPCSDRNPCQGEPVVDAAVARDGDVWILNASATNPGPEPFKVSSICAPAWTDRMTWDGEQVQHREPQATCAAYGTRDWMPDETLWFNTTWDGRLWTCYENCESFGAYQGDYTWTVTIQTLEPNIDFEATARFAV